MTKFMTFIAGAALTAATAVPALANDPFLSTQNNGEQNALVTEGAVAGAAAAVATVVIMLNDGSGSTTTTTTTTTSSSGTSGTAN